MTCVAQCASTVLCTAFKERTHARCQCRSCMLAMLNSFTGQREESEFRLSCSGLFFLLRNNSTFVTIPCTYHHQTLANRLHNQTMRARGEELIQRLCPCIADRFHCRNKRLTSDKRSAVCLINAHVCSTSVSPSCRLQELSNR